MIFTESAFFAAIDNNQRQEQRHYLLYEQNIRKKYNKNAQMAFGGQNWTLLSTLLLK